MQRNKLEWETVYSDKGNFQKMEYPSEIVVNFVRKSRFDKIALEKKKEIKCCDLGCGWGNNLKEVFRVLKPGGIFFSSMVRSGDIKFGDTEFLTGYLTEEELKSSLAEFSHFDLDYLRITRNNRKEDFSHYLITATK